MWAQAPKSLEEIVGEKSQQKELSAQDIEQAIKQDKVVVETPKPWRYEPLTVEEVRWYWLKQPYSLKDIHKQDVPHRAHLQRFCDADNHKLEDAFREGAEEIEKAWWEETAALSRPGMEVTLPKENAPAATREEEPEAGPMTWAEFVAAEPLKGEVAGVPVRSGLYEVDLPRRRMRCAYWPEAAKRVLRATWFVEKGQDWVPLKEIVADELEEAYRRAVWEPAKGRVRAHKNNMQAARIDLPHFVNEVKGTYALFTSHDEMYLCKDDYTSWISRTWGAGKSAGARLRRGALANPPPTAIEVDARQEEVDNAAAHTPASHLVLCVHGIGQNLTGSNVGDDAGNVRNNMRQLAEHELSEEQRAAGRVEVLPIQWRKQLNLDVDVLARALMPAGVRNLRQMLHATAVEVLLYLTPLHCQDMLASLVAAMNAQYARFMIRNPNFRGKVSVLAHSLGSVLSYDVLCNQPHLHAVLGRSQHPSDATPQHADSAALSDLDPISSSDLGPVDSRMPERGASTGINSDLMDLTCMLTPSPGPSRLALSQRPSAEQQLRSENDRLRQEVAALQRERRSRTSLTGGHQPPTEPPSVGGAVPSSGSGSELAPGQGWRRAAAAMQEKAHLAPPVDIPPLDFEVDQFVCIGSPLGLFLALRKVSPARGTGLGTKAAAGLMLGAAAQQGDGLPAVSRIFNLYHQYDPVAYRVEPLVVEGAEARPPVFAAYARGGKRLHVGIQEFSEDVGAAVRGGVGNVSSAIFGGFNAVRTGAAVVGSFIPFRRIQEQDAEADARAEGAAGQGDDTAREAAAQKAARALAALPIWSLTDGPGASPEAAASTPYANRTAAGRIDFVLQTSTTENPWLSAISSHFAYWSSADTALFLLRALYGVDVRQGIPLKAAEEVLAGATAT